MLRVIALVGSVAAPLAAFAGDGAAPGRAADPYASVVSNGMSIPAIVAAEAASPAWEGRAIPGKALDSLADIKAIGQPTAAVAELATLPRVPAPKATPEVIIGRDDRVRVERTTAYPASATVLITFFTGFSFAQCSGWLINANTVVTAGHCVHQGRGGTWYPTTSFSVYPGQNGRASPYGGCSARWLATVQGWISRGSNQFDYGAIKLNCRIGDTTGYYGFFATTTNIDGAPTVIAGYPGDKALTQWRSRGKVTVTRARQIFYKNDTFGGMSGSPVYGRYSNCSYCAFGIHDAGAPGNNVAVKIMPDVVRNLVSWRNAF